MVVRAAKAKPIQTTPVPQPPATTSVVAAPIVKWPGGKTKLLPELVKRAPATFGRYYEPFAGGAALFFRIGNLGLEGATLNDLNPDLINVYRSVRDDVEAVLHELRHRYANHSEPHYYQTRDEWNAGGPSIRGIAELAIRPSTPVERAAMFIYLNKTCYNGLWRVNRAGKFNVPIGDYKRPPVLPSDALRAARAALEHTALAHGDYRKVIAEVYRGDFLYFDPPYDPLTPTSNFTSYTTSAFGREQQAELAAVARDLVGKGCKVMLSNSDTPFVRSLYRARAGAGATKTFKISRVTCGRAINSSGGKRGKVNEVIITGGY